MDFTRRLPFLSGAGLVGWFSLMLCIAFSSSAIATPRESARYTVTFDSTWSAVTHPEDFPSNPHYSSLVGATHNRDVVFWRPGELASDGIQQVAELGRTTQIKAEINAAIEAGTAFDLITGGGIASSPGSVSTSFEIHPSHPLVTLVTMIAPSPDWFVGVRDLSLIKDGRWAEELVVTIFPYDAGTDSGITYGSPNAVTDPPEPIFLIDGPPFRVGDSVPSLGTLTFRRTDLICDVALSQDRYVDGDTITIDMWRLANLNPDPTRLEIGIWLDRPGLPPLSRIDNVFDVPAQSDEDMGPLGVQIVTSDLPRGQYAVGCRALDPVTKQLRYEDIESFEVQ